MTDQTQRQAFRPEPVTPQTEASALSPRGESGKPHRNPHFRPDIEGLRAVSVLAVFVTHLFGFPTGGFVGVDVFFVISGFLITGLMIREFEKTGRISLKRFYVRRARRILPASLLVIAATVGAGIFWLPATTAYDTFIDGLYATFFSANWRLISVGTDYFGQSALTSPLQHYWSLAVEEQFYFVWPTVLVLALGLAGQRRPRLVIGVAAGTVLISSLAFAAYLTTIDPTDAYFSSFTRAWELAVGALLAVISNRLTSLGPGRWRVALSWLGLGGIVVSVFVIDTATPFPVPGALLPVLSAAAVIAAFTGATPTKVWLLTNPVATYIGKLSYSLYLWHWPIIVIAGTHWAPGKRFYAVTIVATIACSALSHHFFEDPIHHSRWLSQPRNRFSAIAWPIAGVLVISVAASTAIVGRDLTAFPWVQTDYSDSPLSKESCFGAQALDKDHPECQAKNLTTPYIPSIELRLEDKADIRDCFFKLDPSDPDKPADVCHFGSQRKSALKMALVGDSHLGAIIPAFRIMAERNEWAVTTYMGFKIRMSGLPPDLANYRLNDVVSPKHSQRDLDLDLAHRQYFKDVLAPKLLAEKYDVIFTTGWTYHGYSGETEQAVLEVWRPFLDAGTKIVVMKDVPNVSDPLTRCMEVPGNPEKAACDLARNQAFPEPDVLAAAARLDPRVTLIDVTDLLCTADKCPQIIGHVVVYADDISHLTGTFAKTLTPYLEPKLLEAIRRA